MKIKLLREDVQLPKIQTKGSAGYDLYVPEDTHIKYGRQVIKMGFMMAVPKGMCVMIDPRSGFSAKGFAGYYNRFDGNEERFDCDVVHGMVDSDYRGEVGVIVNNHDMPFWVKKGERIAQMTIQPYFIQRLEVCDTLDDTERGDGGFNSTGV